MCLLMRHQDIFTVCVTTNPGFYVKTQDFAPEPGQILRAASTHQHHIVTIQGNKNNRIASCPGHSWPTSGVSGAHGSFLRVNQALPFHGEHRLICCLVETLAEELPVTVGTTTLAMTCFTSCSDAAHRQLEANGGSDNESLIPRFCLGSQSGPGSFLLFGPCDHIQQTLIFRSCVWEFWPPAPS